MRIEGTEFGSITIDGKTYDHDVVIRLSGKVGKRHKKLSKEKYGTSHIISQAEAEDVFEDGCDQLIVGAGQAAMCACRPRQKTFSKRRAAELSCSRRPRPSAHSTSRAKKRSGSCM